MPRIEPLQHFYSFSAKKKFGRPNQYGRIVYGFSQYGDDTLLAGIYQKRIKRLNFWTKIDKQKGDTYTCKMRFYHPSNPQTPYQQSWRQIFAGFVAEWKSLDNNQKEVYRKKAIKIGTGGFQLFMSCRLRS